jgi:hypothetical protein
MASPRIAEAVAASLDRKLAGGETDPYDTHPPLRARIASVENRSNRETPQYDLPVISLLGEMAELETRLIKATSTEPSARALRLVAWDDVRGKI